MKNCKCGARLGFIGGYRHPTKGWSEILCSNCFDDEYEKSIKWKEFILANSFVKVPSYEDFLKDCETQSFRQRVDCIGWTCRHAARMLRSFRAMDNGVGFLGRRCAAIAASLCPRLVCLGPSGQEYPRMKTRYAHDRQDAYPTAISEHVLSLNHRQRFCDTSGVLTVIVKPDSPTKQARGGL